MTRWTFAIQWPEPFEKDWKQSSRVFSTIELAAAAMGDYLIISAVNGTMMNAHLVQLPNYIGDPTD